VKVFRPQAVVSKQLHQEWPMALELDGTYHDLARFFDHVSKVPRIINVGGISIKGKPAKDTVADGATITAQCTATTVRAARQAGSEAAASPARSSVPVPPHRGHPRPRSKGWWWISWVTSGGCPCSTHCLGPLRSRSVRRSR
jgi:hypothetical protein